MVKPTLLQFARKCINDKTIELTEVIYAPEMEHGYCTGNITITVRARRKEHA